jgi:hypothetical protein
MKGKKTKSKPSFGTNPREEKSSLGFVPNDGLLFVFLHKSERGKILFEGNRPVRSKQAGQHLLTTRQREEGLND